MSRPVVVISKDVTSHLIRFCEETGRRRLLLVADNKTYPILGEAVLTSLQSRGFEARSVVLTSSEVVADSHHVLQVLLACNRREETFISVGSGTITDITRFVSHRTGGSFIAMPTAPSVDGFTSLGSPLIVRGIKRTALAHSPVAIFADLEVLSSAPHSMIASGFGDMLGKHTSVADWKLGSLLWDLPYDKAIAERCLGAVRNCEEAALDLAATSETGVRSLFESLLESGFCMLDFGSSFPASGAEHHYSHFWEMKLLREGKPPILHGAKVGVATIFIAEAYERIKQISAGILTELLKASILPSREEEIRRIHEAYGPAAEEVLQSQTKFLDMDEAGYERLKRKIINHWGEIQEIAQKVPSPRRIAELLRCAGGPTSLHDLGLLDSDREQAAENAHYLRNHFTISRLNRILFQRGFQLTGVSKI